jgi:hypothetical protein
VAQEHPEAVGLVAAPDDVFGLGRTDLDCPAQGTEPVGELSADLLCRGVGQADAEQVDVRLRDPRLAGSDGAVHVELDVPADGADFRDRVADDRLEGGGHAIPPCSGHDRPVGPDLLSNWGRWGADDERGALNHITDEVRLAAARAVRHGRSVSCGWEITVPEEMERATTVCPCAAEMPGAEQMPELFHGDRRWGFSNEQLGIFFHGNTITHLDSPCHLFWDGRMYNGRSHALVESATGSAWAAVTAAAEGIVTRGVLLDVAAVRDVSWLEPGEGVFPEDLEAAERRQGVRVRSGDAVLLRTGGGRKRHEGGAAGGITKAGWHASCLPWLRWPRSTSTHELHAFLPPTPVTERFDWRSAARGR